MCGLPHLYRTEPNRVLNSALVAKVTNSANIGKFPDILPTLCSTYPHVAATDVMYTFLSVLTLTKCSRCYQTPITVVPLTRTVRILSFFYWPTWLKVLAA